ncbi:hypothetical protein FDI40_gp324 [Agrobacterium phage Atu_ph07]|uniref:Uncharacterized protein n=1 Tax=Agrobacterium phage Atu_ph07 TaxID=2024264 RepID=A0A223W0B8_9CAUD|nr:hypothetical protein FDI40_gp324 [Agrobacterium phage Atu_ph07]ASV44746.1 hypothetical protein [Agrobacterium phage Atu_ph07]
MALNNEQKIDILWKKSKNVTSTGTSKQSYNERYASNSPIMQRQIWSNSDNIPLVAPSDEFPNPNAYWSRIMFPFKGENAGVLVRDPNSPNAWIALREPNIGITDNNRITNWIPETLHRSYTVKVWTANPTISTIDIEQLLPYEQNYEWEFDYGSGILYFPNQTPSLDSDVLYIEGWQYTGSFGGGSGTGSSQQKITLSYSTPALDVDESYEFTLATGGSCILIETLVNAPCAVECSAFESYDDTNPYRFVAVESQLFDDGSYVIGGQRYYGERFINLVNLTDPSADHTYWKITNTGVAGQVITINVQVLS